MQFIQKPLRWVNILVIFITLLAYLAPYINPENMWHFSFLGIAYPWLLLFNILFILHWVFRRQWYALFSIGCILLGWTHFTNFVGLNFSTGKATENSFKILTYNINGPSINKKNLAKSFERLNNFFNQQNSDILCFQEYNYTDRTTDPVYKGATSLGAYPYKFKNPAGEQAILSKFPILNKGTLNIGSISNGCIFADIDIKGSKIRVYSIHLESNRITRTANRIADELKLEEKETWTDIRSMMAKVRRASFARAEQAKIIADHADASPYPVVLCGDFNETPLSYPYHLLAKNRLDAFKEKGLGLGTTFGGSIPALRIDYTLTDKSIQVLDNIILKDVSISDHYPVVSLLNL